MLLTKVVSALEGLTGLKIGICPVAQFVNYITEGQVKTVSYLPHWTSSLYIFRVHLNRERVQVFRPRLLLAYSIIEESQTDHRWQHGMQL